MGYKNGSPSHGPICRQLIVLCHQMCTAAVCSSLSLCISQGLGLAASVYSTGRSLLVPSPLAGVAGTLESTVSSISRPVFHAVQDQSGKVTHIDAWAATSKSGLVPGLARRRSTI